MFNPDPAAYLPHRYPFLMLDTLLELEPGVRGRALLRATNLPVGFPQMLLVEAIAQLAGIVTIQEEGEGGFLAAIDHAEFGPPAIAGDTLTISATLVKSFGRLFLAEGTVECAGAQLAQARLTLGVGRF